MLNGAVDFSRVKEQINALSVVEYLGFKTKLRGNRHWMCCPLHKEKTPSLVIYPSNRGYYCFGCGIGGDSIDLYARIKGISNTVAAEELSEVFRLQQGNSYQVVQQTYTKYIRHERQELDRLVIAYRLIERLLKPFNVGDDIPEVFWDYVQIKADLEMKIDSLCMC